MSLTNPNTPVSQQDLQDFYHKLLPYIGGSFGLVATGIDSANLYSTTERVIGQWIDGKPLYQKVVEFTITNSNAWTDYNHGISNIDKCVSMDCFAVYNNEIYTVGPKHNESFMSGFFGKTSVSVSSKNYTNYTARCILRYTKTTDSAVESYGTDTTYSTDEHVVGSWIDGSPLYQKTYDMIVPNDFSANTDYTLPNTVPTGANMQSAFIDASASFIVYPSHGTRSPVFIYDNNVNNVWVSEYGIRLRSNGDMNWLKGTRIVITLRYTKTT